MQLKWSDSFPSLLWCNTALYLLVMKIAFPLTSLKEKEYQFGADYRRFRPTALIEDVSAYCRGVGVDDLKGYFQSKLFHDSLFYGQM